MTGIWISEVQSYEMSDREEQLVSDMLDLSEKTEGHFPPAQIFISKWRSHKQHATLVSPS